MIDFDLRDGSSWALVGYQASRYVGWLLRVNRVLGPHKAWHSGRQFAQAYRQDRGGELAPSHISRWESGHLAATRTTIRRYEHLLQLPPESLVTVSDAMLRAAGLIQPAPRRDSTGNHRLHELLEQAQAKAAMSGADWTELSELIEQQPSLVLHPPRLWRVIMENLLSELVMATYAQWLQRQEAMSRLLEHPTAAPHAVSACIALAGDRSSPIFIEPMALLEVTARADATGYILSQVAQPDHDRVLHGALLASLHKVSRRHFDASQTRRLASYIHEYMTDPALSLALAPIAAEVGRYLLPQLPEGTRLHRAIQRSVRTHADRQVREDNELTARAMSESLALKAIQQMDRPQDETLAQLIERSLFSADPDHRMLASMLLAATPLQHSVATAILRDYTKDLASRSGKFPLTTLRTLTNLGVDLHRPLIHHILSGAGFTRAVAHAAAWATPHCPGSDPVPVWSKSLAGQIMLWKQDRTDLAAGILQGITYGIGTDGHRSLLAKISQDPSLPADTRVTATWLLQEP